MKLLSRLPRRDRRSGQNRRKTDLTFDLFEDRVLLTAYTVNDAADTLSGNGDTGTLRYIIHQLSVDGTATNDIKFAIPGPGVQTITLGADLDPIQRQVTIEGYTQTGASQNSQSVGTNAVITIQLNLNGHQGLVFQAGATTDAAGSIVQGLAIFGGSGAAIDIQTNSVTVSGNFLGVKADGTTAGAGANGVSVATGVTGAAIGSTANVDRNLISGNTGAGLSIAGTAIVQGNLIGTDRSGLLAVGNQDGLLLVGSGNTVGGTSAGAGNLISGNAQSGIRVDGSGNLISGNSIGLNASGGALPNSQDGVRLEATAGSNTIGGTSPGTGNFIGFNTAAGVEIASQAGTGNVLIGNFIGTNAAGALQGNGTGVIVSSAGNLIGQAGAGNTIGGNTCAGVSISGAAASGQPGRRQLHRHQRGRRQPEQSPRRHH